MADKREIERVLERFVQEDQARVVRALERALGPQDVDLAEPSVGEATARARRVWPMRGVPADPAAWLLRAARNAAVDAARRAGRTRGTLPDLARLYASDESGTELLPPEAAEEQVRIMLACCTPALPRVTRAMLMLRVVAGLSTDEIGAAFVMSTDAVAQRIARAQRVLTPEAIALLDDAALPDDERVAAVIDAVCLAFTRGHANAALTPEAQLDLTDEAVRLGVVLTRAEATDRPEARALVAMMLLQSARAEARRDGLAGLKALAGQDAPRWDAERIELGMRHLAAAQGEGAPRAMSEYHAMAEIAACHAAAAESGRPDWARIAALYDTLETMNPGPAVRLERAAAVLEARGPAAALEALRELEADPTLRDDYRLAALRGEALLRLGRGEEAAAAFEAGANRAPTDPERQFLLGRAGTARGG